MAVFEVVGTPSMAKGMTITGMVVSGLILLLFLMDLLIQIPFKRASVEMDIAFIISAIGLLFLSWTTWREFD